MGLEPDGVDEPEVASKPYSRATQPTERDSHVTGNYRSSFIAFAIAFAVALLLAALLSLTVRVPQESSAPDA